MITAQRPEKLIGEADKWSLKEPKWLLKGVRN
jgi:hypothetical protein